MMRVSFFITLSCVGLLLGCGKGTDQAKEVQPKAQPKTEVKKQSEPSPPNNPPANPTAPKDNAKTPQPVKNADENQTAQFASDKSFLQSLRPLHEGKPSTLKIELQKIRAKGEPTTLQELNAWFKAVPSERNAALAFNQARKVLPNNHFQLIRARKKVHIFGYRQLDPREDPKDLPEGAILVRDGVLNMDAGQSKEFLEMQATLTAHEAYVNQLFSIHQRFPINVPARFPIDWTHGHSTLLPHLAGFRSTTEILKWRCKYFALLLRPPALQGQTVGEQQQAVSSLLALLRIIHLLDAEPALISVHTVSSNFKDAKDALELLLNCRTLTDAQLVLLHQMFASFNWPHLFVNALIGERTIIVDSEAIARTGTPEQIKRIDSEGHLFEEPLITLLRRRTDATRDFEMTTYIGLMNSLIAAIRKGYHEFSTYDDADGKFQTQWAQIQELTKNPLHARSYPYMPRFLSALTNVPVRLHISVGLQQLSTTALAIERYRLATQGKLPKTLQELVPKFLASHPFDPYTGKPMAYEPGNGGKYKLWIRDSDHYTESFWVQQDWRQKK